VSNRISIQTSDFDINAESTALKTAITGAIVTFVGVVRGDADLSSMTLEHYPGMTEREIARHVEEAQVRWPGIEVRIVHRVGRLAPGENIVLVAVAAAHRQAAFGAAEFLMDYLKTRAPFWKLEERPDTTAWVEARPCDEQAVSRWQRED
jgi:molybdopterin synthase catalytic subunit